MARLVVAPAPRQGLAWVPRKHTSTARASPAHALHGPYRTIPRRDIAQQTIPTTELGPDGHLTNFTPLASLPPPSPSESPGPSSLPCQQQVRQHHAALGSTTAPSEAHNQQEASQTSTASNLPSPPTHLTSSSWTTAASPNPPSLSPDIDRPPWTQIRTTSSTQSPCSSTNSSTTMSSCG